MHNLYKKTAIVAAVLASSVSYATAQSGPVDSKGQAGAAAHRAMSGPSGANGTVATGDLSAAARASDQNSASDATMTDGRYRAAEMRRGSDNSHMRAGSDTYANPSPADVRGHGEGPGTVQPR